MKRLILLSWIVIFIWSFASIYLLSSKNGLRNLIRLSAAFYGLDVKTLEEPKQESNSMKGNSMKGVVSKKKTEIISRVLDVSVTCDTRGNLGPCSVVVQASPGSDWLKDRWQAASDMGIICLMDISLFSFHHTHTHFQMIRRNCNTWCALDCS